MIGQEPSIYRFQQNNLYCLHADHHEDIDEFKRRIVAKQHHHCNALEGGKWFILHLRNENNSTINIPPQPEHKGSQYKMHIYSCWLIPLNTWITFDVSDVVHISMVQKTLFSNFIPLGFSPNFYYKNRKSGKKRVAKSRKFHTKLSHVGTSEAERLNSIWLALETMFTLISGGEHA